MRERARSNAAKEKAREGRGRSEREGRGKLVCSDSDSTNASKASRLGVIVSGVGVRGAGIAVVTGVGVIGGGIVDVVVVVVSGVGVRGGGTVLHGGGTSEPKWFSSEDKRTSTVLSSMRSGAKSLAINSTSLSSVIGAWAGEEDAERVVMSSRKWCGRHVVKGNVGTSVTGEGTRFDQERLVALMYSYICVLSAHVNICVMTFEHMHMYMYISA